MAASLKTIDKRMRRLSAVVGTAVKENIEKLGKKKIKKPIHLLDPLSRKMPSMLVQIWHYHMRSMLVQTSKETLIDLILISLSGLALGLVYVSFNWKKEWT